MKEVYKVQVEYAKNFSRFLSPRQAKAADNNCLLLACLASFVGWNHEVITDDCSDEYDGLMENIIEKCGDDHVGYQMTAAYEMAVCIVENCESKNEKRHQYKMYGCHFIV